MRKPHFTSSPLLDSPQNNPSRRTAHFLLRRADTEEERMAFQTYFQGKEHIIWDFNGTIMDDIDLSLGIINSMLQEEGLPSTNKQAYQKNFRFPVIDYYRTLGFSDVEARWPELSQRYMTAYNREFANCTLIPGIHDVLKETRTKVPYQSVLSAAEHGFLQELLRHFEIYDLFNHRFGIDSIHADSKIGRGEELLDLVKIEKAKTVIVGDTTHDLEVGKALGIDVVLVDHGHQCATVLARTNAPVVRLL